VDAHFIALAVPFFFTLIGVEILVNRRRGELAYSFHDAVGSLSCGIGQQLLGIFFVSLQIAGYAFVYDHLRVATISPRSPLAWIVLLFALDFFYFVYHWASHRVGFFWATHAVHHQSEEYNLSTALRQSWFTGLTSWIFYVPLAVAGFSPLMFVLMRTVNTLYQFWIHTRSIGRLGVLEAFLNTPSHHRVHHGIDPRYIDTNYAGIFIVWDRLFGTFTPEQGEPVYGTVKPLASFNPFWANLEPWVQMARMARRARRLRDKLYVWIAPPEWRPADLGGVVTIPEVSRAAQHKYEVEAPRGLDAYVAVHFVIVTALTTYLLWVQNDVERPALAASVAWLMGALLGWSGLTEGRRWAVPFEWLRLASAVVLGAALTRGSPRFAPMLAGSLATALIFAVWVGRYRGRARELAPVPST
jgi:alkylglycerol monooxygenase